jgi:hypothetical protein
MMDTKRLYSDLGGIVADKVLRCPRCATVETPSRAQMSYYFRKGWPICCGQTLELIDAVPSE